MFGKRGPDDGVALSSMWKLPHEARDRSSSSVRNSKFERYQCTASSLVSSFMSQDEIRDHFISALSALDDGAAFRLVPRC